MRKLETGQNTMDLSEREAEILIENNAAVACERQGREHVLILWPGLRFEHVRGLLPGYD